MLLWVGLLKRLKKKLHRELVQVFVGVASYMEMVLELVVIENALMMVVDQQVLKVVA